MDRFEVFTRALIARARPPQVSITKAGAISMNAAAHALIGSPDLVLLSFASDNRCLWIRASSPDNEAARPVRPAKTSPNGPYVVSAIADLRERGLGLTESHRWSARREGDALRVDLDGGPMTRVDGRSRRPRPSPVRRRDHVRPD